MQGQGRLARLQRPLKSQVIELKGPLARAEDFGRAAVEALVQAALETEMTGRDRRRQRRAQRDSAVVPQRLLS
jgi:hypothetical protein